MPKSLGYFARPLKYYCTERLLENFLYLQTQGDRLTEIFLYSQTQVDTGRYMWAEGDLGKFGQTLKT